MNPRARGDVKLRSDNPHDLPLINPNFFSNKENINQKAMIKPQIKHERTMPHDNNKHRQSNI